jgi:50S ribosomal protein L16 3-hydroxylase
MLYLPPGWGHDGVADDDGQSPGTGQDCMTCSIGFRAPAAHELARELLLRLADDIDTEAAPARRYSDRQQPATTTPALMPETLLTFAKNAVAQQLADADALPRLLGEILSEPKPQVWFEAQASQASTGAVVLNARSRMLYDPRHVFINGEALRASGRDATLMRRLADTRRLSAAERLRLSAEASSLLNDWIQAGWVHLEKP